MGFGSSFFKVFETLKSKIDVRVNPSKCLPMLEHLLNDIDIAITVSRPNPCSTHFS